MEFFAGVQIDSVFRFDKYGQRRLLVVPLDIDYFDIHGGGDFTEKIF